MSETILIVDDDETTLARVQSIAQKEGFVALTALDGQQGLRVFERELPDILITDLRMPRIDGMELLHRARKLRPETQVIMMTGYGDYDTVIYALRAGAIDYLRKPLDLDAMLLALGRARENIAMFRNNTPPPTLLVVEDDDFNRERLKRILAKEGYRVLAAADGASALAAFQETKVDVALVDLRLPSSDGIAVMRELHSLSEEVACIIVTGCGDDESAAQAMREGAADYLRKPLDIEHLLTVVNKAFETVTLKRALLYRQREVVLAREIVAKVTSAKELVVDARGGLRLVARDFAESLIDALPIAMIALLQDLSVVYANATARSILGESAPALTPAALDRLELELEIGELKETIVRLLGSTKPNLEPVKLDKSRLLLTKAFVVTESHDTVKVAVILCCAPQHSRP